MATPAFSILCCFARLKDPRLDRRKRHLLLDLVAIALCAVLAGADNWQQIEAFGRKRRDWLKTFLSLPNGIASPATRVATAPGPRSRVIKWSGREVGQPPTPE